MASGPERVQAALAGLGLDTEVVRVPGSAKTAQLAAESVNCAVGAIVKSLLFVVDGQPVLVLCAGEETGCEGALALASSGALGRCGAVLAAEPTTNYPCVAHKGVVWADAVARGMVASRLMPARPSDAGARG